MSRKLSSYPSLKATISLALFAMCPSNAGAQEEDHGANPERDLILECLTESEEVVGVTFAINAERKRARARPHKGGRARPTYGVYYTPETIGLYPNRQAPNPPPMNFTLDRKTLVLTYWKASRPGSMDRIIIATAQCAETTLEPELMPKSRRNRKSDETGQ